VDNLTAWAINQITMGLLDFILRKTIKTESGNHKAKILDLMNLGIDFNWEFLGDKETGLLSDLQGNSSDNNFEYWLILREMGGQFYFWTTNRTLQSVPYSKNVSTIVYEDFLSGYKLSKLFEELKRITNTKIDFQVIDEFNSVYDAKGKEHDPEFWNHSEYIKGEKNYLCKYIVNGKYLEIEYSFMDFSPQYLNGNFIICLIKALQELLSENNVSFIYPEEFATFFICNKQFRPKMREYLGTYCEESFDRQN
jgi:hypothetical protein